MKRRAGAVPGSGPRRCSPHPRTRCPTALRLAPPPVPRRLPPNGPPGPGAAWRLLLWSRGRQGRAPCAPVSPAVTLRVLVPPATLGFRGPSWQWAKIRAGSCHVRPDTFGEVGGPLRIRAPSSHLRNTAPAATLCSRGAGAQGHLPCSPRFPSPQAEDMGHLQSQVSCQVDRTRGGGTCVGGGGGQRGRPCAVAGEGPGAEGAHAHPGRGEPHTTTLPGLWARASRRGARLPRAERGGDSAAPAALRVAPPDPPIPRAGRSGPPRLCPAAPTLPPLALGLEWPLLLLAGPGGSGTSQNRFLGLEFCPWL